MQVSADTMQSSHYVTFDADICTGCTNCIKACPTKAIRLYNDNPSCLTDNCIRCGECVRVCPTGAISTTTYELEALQKDKVSITLVSPVLYSQFKGIMPNDILHAVKKIGFHHAMDLSYYIEMYLYAAEEYISENRITGRSPWPLISPVCPVVIRLIAYQFPNLLPHIIPIMRPMSLLAKEARANISREYKIKRDAVILYHLTPCPAKMVPSRSSFSQENSLVDRTMGIKDVYAQITGRLNHMKKTGVEASEEESETQKISGNCLLWGISGGEIAGINSDKTLAVSGLRETIAYLEKIEMGLFKDIEYIEFRTCPEGCVGGALNAVDKYIAKNTVLKMLRKFGLERLIPHDKVILLYENGWGLSDTTQDELQRIFGVYKEHISIEQLKEIEKILEQIQGKDCAACGAPDCRTFAEDVVMGKAKLNDCIMLRKREIDKNLENK
ncbi:MAG: [Fe-Fe] hydrogenase large subunit C-terminal domain-containing protein [Desulfobacterales bacterium]|nr:[Fe-Fe] hydrogenase large subunit C-terminal domain-containing protein [Desulfobacterales bacterium]